MNGYSQLAVIIWIALTAAALLGLAVALLLFLAVRHAVRWYCDERSEEVPPC